MKQIHVCPECKSSDIRTTVSGVSMFIDEHGDWMPDLPLQDEMVALIETPSTSVYCETCDWEGTWAELQVLDGTALDGLQYDGVTPDSITPVFSDFNDISFDDLFASLPYPVVGDIIQWKHGEEIIIKMIPTPCLFRDSISGATEKKTMTVYLIASYPVSSYTDANLTVYTFSQLYHAIKRKDAVIIKTKQDNAPTGDDLIDDDAGDEARTPSSSVFM